MEASTVLLDCDLSHLTLKFLLFLVASVLLIFIILPVQSSHAVELYSANDKPFGITLGDWIGKWWNWWISLTTEQVPKTDGCLMNEWGPMIMLMNPTETSPPLQKCNISSKQGIMIALWSGFCEASNPSLAEYHYSYKDLSLKCVREDVNSGAIVASLKVDGIVISKVDVDSSRKGGSYVRLRDYKTNALELYSPGFNISIPNADTAKMSGQVEDGGTFRSGAGGWYVFLKPLSPGQHEIEYSNAVRDPNYHSTTITYLMNVN